MIVNSVPADLDFKKGAVSKSILKAAGNAIENEAKTNLQAKQNTRAFSATPSRYSSFAAAPGNRNANPYAHSLFGNSSRAGVQRNRIAGSYAAGYQKGSEAADGLFEILS